MEKRYKIQIFMVLVLFISFITYASFKPSITGHVSANVYHQNLDLVINKSQNFLLSSDNLEPFIVSSLKISGNITGNGQVKVYIHHQL